MGTRADIEAEVAAILDRDDLAAVIPNWVSRAHLAIQMRHTWAATQWSFTTAPAAGAWAIEAPPDIRLPLMIGYYAQGTQQYTRPIHLTSYETVRGLRATYRLGLFGGFWNGKLELSEAVDGVTDDVVVRYDYHRFLSLPAGPNDRDWLTIYGHGALVYRALEESAPYLGDDTRLELWRERFNDGFKELYSADVQAVAAGELVLRG